MNRLQHNDICFCETPEERIRIMELFKDKLEIHRNTWEERYEDGDYEDFPYLCWDREEGLLADDEGYGYNLMSVNNFLNKAGLMYTPQGGSFIKHYFI